MMDGFTEAVGRLGFSAAPNAKYGAGTAAARAARRTELDAPVFWMLPPFCPVLADSRSEIIRSPGELLG